MAVNWSVGTLMVVASLFIIMKIFRNEDIKINSITLDILIIFALNFTLTGFVVFFAYINYHKDSNII